jgi:hypothetical protein
MRPLLLGFERCKDSCCQLRWATPVDELEEGVEIDSSVAS